jgi:hypothetical protein
MVMPASVHRRHLPRAARPLLITDIRDRRTGVAQVTQHRCECLGQCEVHEILLVGVADVTASNGASRYAAAGAVDQRYSSASARGPADRHGVTASLSGATSL